MIDIYMFIIHFVKFCIFILYKIILFKLINNLN